jgi:hypothetical protein
MKRLLSVGLFIFCLSFPVFGGHTQAGNWCNCGTPSCICDPGEQPENNLVAESKQRIDESEPVGSESVLLLVAMLFLWLKMKA